MSSLLSLGSRSAIVVSTTAAGTISQMARGFCSLATNSSREAAPVAPSPESCFTESAAERDSPVRDSAGRVLPQHRVESFYGTAELEGMQQRYRPVEFLLRHFVA